jgi:hypothetical protein
MRSLPYVSGEKYTWTESTGTAAQNHRYLISRVPIDLAGERMSKRAVDMTFQAIFTLTDLRILLRESAPSHEFDANQKTQAQRLLENLERQVGSLKREILK